MTTLISIMIFHPGDYYLTCGEVFAAQEHIPPTLDQGNQYHNAYASSITICDIISYFWSIWSSVPARPLHRGAAPCPHLDMPCAFDLAPSAFISTLSITSSLVQWETRTAQNPPFARGQHWAHGPSCLFYISAR